MTNTETPDIYLLVGELALALGESLTNHLRSLKENGYKFATMNGLIAEQKELGARYIVKCVHANIDKNAFIEACKEISIPDYVIEHISTL